MFTVWRAAYCPFFSFKQHCNSQYVFMNYLQRLIFSTWMIRPCTIRFQLTTYHLFIHCSSVTALSWSGSQRNQSLSWEHWVQGKYSASMGHRSITGHHAQTHSHIGSVCGGQSTTFWEVGGNSTQIVIWVIKQCTLEQWDSNTTYCANMLPC